MTKKDITIIADYTVSTPLTLEDFCEICRVNEEYLRDMIEFGIVAPMNEDDNWQFEPTYLQRAQTALRLQRDLEINLAGAALVLDLLDQIQDLRTQAEILERHLKGR